MLRFVTLARLAQIKADARKEVLAEVKEILNAIQPDPTPEKPAPTPVKHAAAIQPVKKNSKRNNPATSSNKQGR